MVNKEQGHDLPRFGALVEVIPLLLLGWIMMVELQISPKTKNRSDLSG
jgi:hypothetical protein